MICLYACFIEDIHLPLAFPIGELCYEISDDLSFDGGMQAVLNIILIQLYSS